MNVVLVLPSPDQALSLRLVGGAARPASQPTNGPVRHVLALPGSDCRMAWLDLSAHSLPQARAAAGLWAAQSSALSDQALHVAVAATATAGRYLVVTIARARLAAWLAQAERQHIDIDAVVPDCLLLPDPGTQATPQAGTLAGQWLVRGHELAFSGEPELARMVAGTSLGGPLAEADTVQAMLATAAAPVLPVDLLQGAFARASHATGQVPQRKRLAWLAAALLLSPLLLLLAQTVRYQYASFTLRQQSQRIAHAVTARAGITTSPDQAVAELERNAGRLLAGADFFHDFGTLLTAVAQAPKARIESLAYQDKAFRATISFGDEPALQSLQQALSSSGLPWRAGAASQGQVEITVGDEQ